MGRMPTVTSLELRLEAVAAFRSRWRVDVQRLRENSSQAALCSVSHGGTYPEEHPPTQKQPSGGSRIETAQTPALWTA
jgi:hypothetical protein